LVKHPAPFVFPLPCLRGVPSLFKVTAIPKNQKKEKALVDSNL
jgi:hypothetical protein